MGGNTVVRAEADYHVGNSRYSDEVAKDAVEEINRLSNLPCNLLEGYDKPTAARLEKLGFFKFNHFPFSGLYNEDMRLIFGRHSFYAPSDRLTILEYETDRFDVLGLKVGMIRFQAESVLISYGYRLTKKDSYKKDIVMIVLFGNRFLEKIRVKVIKC